MKSTNIGKWLLLGVCIIGLAAAAPNGCKDPTTKFVADGTITLKTNAQTGAISVQTNGVYTLAPSIQTGLTAANDVTPFIPTPWGTVATAGLAVVSGLLGLWVRRKNGQIATISDALDASQTIAGLVKPLIAGVEAANDPSTKKSITLAAAAAGVQDVLHTTVQDVVKDVPNAKFVASPST